jgi:polysaccharide chain length determinant protein (PEP-CTERM system associated)
MNLLVLVRRYAAAGWVHRWKALVLAWLICLAGWAGVYSIPDSYTASARIYADADAILGNVLRGIAVDGSQASQVDTLQRTLLSRPNLERLVARTDLDLRITDAVSREVLLERLAKDIKLTPQTRQLFKIEYVDRDPRLAYSVVQTLINLFMESATGTDRQQMQQARTFIAQQIAAYEVQLRESERRRAEFRARYLDLLPSEQQGGSTRLAASQAKLGQLKGELQDAQTRRELLRQQIELVSAPPPAQAAARGGGGGGGVNAGRLAEAERSLRELRLRFTDQHPDVVTARSIVAELRASGGGGGGGGGGGARGEPAAPRQDPARTGALLEQLRLRQVDSDTQIASLERQVRDEQAENERLEELARTAPHVQAEFQNLDRDYNVVRKNYEELLARRESLQIAGAARTDADRVRLDVVEPPTVPQRPTGPNRLLFASAVLVVGIGAGLGLMVLLVQFDRGFYTVHDLRKLGLPLLGAISSAVPRRRATAGAMVFACATALLLVAYGTVLAGGPILLAKLPQLVNRLLA